MRIRVCLVTLLTLVAWSERGYAQGWSTDARKLALGNVGTNRNIASEMVESDPKYRSIVIPLGLLQLIGNFDKFDPSSNNFDPVRAMEYIANPYHFTVGRNEPSAGQKIVNDIFNQRLSTNLADYRGFVPSSNPKAEGIASFSLIHKTFKIPTGGSTFQGIYVGIGPYFTEQTSIDIDQRFIDFLSGDAATLPTQFLIGVNRSTTQMAGALTFGYRAHMGLPAGLPSTGTDREGIYVAVNYNYLRGFHLEDIGMNVRFDTDGSTGVVFGPAQAAIQMAPCPADNTTPGGPYGTPFCTERRTSSSGTGRAIDFGVATVAGPWEIGFGINGVSNQIEWSDVSRETYGLGANVSLTTGNSVPVTLVNTKCTNPSGVCQAGSGNVGSVTIEQPKTVRADAAYHASIATFMGEVASGYLGKTFSGGVEKTFGPLAARGGMHYSNEKWNPSAGVGLMFLPRVGVDLAFLTSTANSEKVRNPVLALSIRINASK